MVSYFINNCWLAFSN